MKRNYLDIDLEPDEKVVLHIRRSRLELILIWAAEVVGAIVLIVALTLVSTTDPKNLGNLNPQAIGYLQLIIWALFAVLIIAGLIGTTIHRSNHLFITNRRAIQKSRTHLLTNSTHVINLTDIEDVSFKQSGLFDQIFHLGTIRMSTVSDETTYTFKFVDTPRDELKTIVKLVTAAKSGKTAQTTA